MAGVNVAIGTRKVLIDEEFVELVAQSLSSDERRLTWVWGKPDDDGFYIPTFTVSSE